jgi:hypothetical protein
MLGGCEDGDINTRLSCLSGQEYEVGLPCEAFFIRMHLQLHRG